MLGLMGSELSLQGPVSGACFKVRPAGSIFPRRLRAQDCRHLILKTKIILALLVGIY